MFREYSPNSSLIEHFRKMLYKKMETLLVPNFSESRAIVEISTINATELQKPKK